MFPVWIPQNALYLQPDQAPGLEMYAALLRHQQTFCTSPPWPARSQPQTCVRVTPLICRETSTYSAWKGRADPMLCPAGTDPLSSDCDVWIAFDLGAPTFVGCIQMYQAGDTASLMHVEASSTGSSWELLTSVWLVRPKCAETSVFHLSADPCCTDEWSCEYVESLPLLPSPSPPRPPSVPPMGCVDDPTCKQR